MTWLTSIFDAAWGWVIAGALLMLLEIFASGVFLFWIGLGASTTGLAFMLFPEAPLWGQIVVFIMAMFASIGLGIAMTRRNKGRDGDALLNTGMASVVGSTAQVVEPFVANYGRIRVQDTTYRAYSEDATLKAGDHVQILGVHKGYAFSVKRATQ